MDAESPSSSWSRPWCPNCGYHTTGLPSPLTCPECGHGQFPGELILWAEPRHATLRARVGNSVHIVTPLAGSVLMIAFAGPLGLFAANIWVQGFFALTAVITTFGLISEWRRAQPIQLRAGMDGYGARAGFGRVRWTKWEPSTELVVERVGPECDRWRVEIEATAGPRIVIRASETDAMMIERRLQLLRRAATAAAADLGAR